VAEASDARKLVKGLSSWAIQWLLFFALLHWGTGKYPEYSWLWWPSLAFFSLGIVCMVGAYFLLNKAADVLQSKIEQSFSDGGQDGE
jgi:drug/metabolite transporter (DMT)-like permease